MMPANWSLRAAAFKDAFARATPAARASAVPVWAGQLFRFVHDVQIGDFIIYPRKIDRTLRWGEIIGPYVYDTEHSVEFAHRRSVCAGSAQIVTGCLFARRVV